MSFGEKSIRCEKIFVSDIFNDHEEQSDNQSRQKSEMSAMWKSKKSEKWQKWIRSCLLASLHHLIPGLTRKKEENMGTASLIRYQNVFISFWTISRTIFGFICSPPSFPFQDFPIVFLSYRILHTIFYPFIVSFIKTW